MSDVGRKRSRAWLVRASTRAFYREGKQVSGYSFLDWLHGYIYARWPYLYIGVGVGEHPLVRFLSPVVGLFTKLFWSEAPDEAAGAVPRDKLLGARRQPGIGVSVLRSAPHGSHRTYETYSRSGGFQDLRQVQHAQLAAAAAQATGNVHQTAGVRRH